MKANFHTHTTFCDGKNSAEEMVLAAIQKGFTALGFSSHCFHPLNPDFYLSFDSLWHIPSAKIKSYTKEIRRLKTKYAGQIDIYLGFEADFLDSVDNDTMDLVRSLSKSNSFGEKYSSLQAFPDKNTYSKYSPDFLIGAVHFVNTAKGIYTVDHKTNVVKENLLKLYSNKYGEIDGKAAVCDYFEAERNMLKKGKFDIIAHPDLVRKRNGEIKFFSENESWYKDEIRETAKAIAKAGVITEINTGAIARGVMDDVYPSAEFLQMLYDRHVPVCISSDAHTTSGLDCAFDRAEQIAKKTGYTELVYPENIIVKI